MKHTLIHQWLQQNTPIEPSLLTEPGLEMLITERLSNYGHNQQAYINTLAQSSDELECLMAAIAVPETWLFRYPRSFDLLQTFLEKLLVKGSEKLRMLSIGCATGQETYSMAMVALHAGWSASRVTIEGMDRNASFLSKAEKGQYGASSVRTEIPAWTVPYLSRSGDTVTIDPAVRAMVRFRRMDISDPAALHGTGPWDVIFCRNVLIYLKSTVREQLMRSICEELARGGMLFVGHAEQTIRFSTALRSVQVPHAFALQLSDEPPAQSIDERDTIDRTKSFGRQPDPLKLRSVISSPASQATPTPRASIDDARDLADSGRTGEAEVVVRNIILQQGISAQAVELLGMIRMSVDDIEAAKRHFEQAIYLEPGRAGALVQLALISEKEGDHRRAASYWDRARRAGSAVDKERHS